MKIIITGATGFIGRNLSESFHKDGSKVLAQGRSLKIGTELQKKGIKFTQADIRNLSQLNQAFEPADCLIHCAAKTADWGKYKEFYETNVIGTQNVIKACKKSNIKKIIFISTLSIYYSGYDRYNILESEALPKKQFNYGRTKLIAERELFELKNEGFKIIIFRPRAVYGPYDRTLVPRILKLSKKNKIPMINGGKALVDITYVGNFIDAVKCCLSAPDDSWNEVYNISNGQPITIREWFSTVLEVFNQPFNPQDIPLPMVKSIAIAMELLSILPFGNKKPALTRFSVGYLARSMTLSIEKAKQLLNYEVKISNKQGFEKYKKLYHFFVD